jgi:hypothetical protein
MRRVYWDGRILCAEMPALIGFATVFEPMWLMDGAVVNGRYVCLRDPPVPALVRVGRGRDAAYYWVDHGVVQRVKMRLTRKLGGGYMWCGRTPSGVKCVEWVDGRLVYAAVET